MGRLTRFLLGFAVMALAGHSSAQLLAPSAKLADSAGGFPAGLLENGDEFGHALAPLGDLNGDGFEDLIVGSSHDDDGGGDRGAAYVLFLNGSAQVQAVQKISDTAGSFAGVLANGDFFGLSVARLGDVNGDGITDVAVGAAGSDDGGGDRGSVWILFLNANGTVKAHQEISDTEGGFSIADGDQFGSSVEGVGDWDGDGIPGDLRLDPDLRPVRYERRRSLQCRRHRRSERGNLQSGHRPLQSAPRAVGGREHTLVEPRQQPVRTSARGEATSPRDRRRRWVPTGE